MSTWASEKNNEVIAKMITLAGHSSQEDAYLRYEKIKKYM
jgi:hypothetical protein